MNPLSHTDTDGDPDAIDDTVPYDAVGSTLTVPEVFDPLPYADFCGRHAHRLARRAGDPAVVVQLRWVERQLCVTGVASVDAATAREWIGPLQLLLEAPIDAADCGERLRVVADELVRMTRASQIDFERVGERGSEVHLLKPYFVEAACGLRSDTWDADIDRPLTCGACLDLFYRGSGPEPAEPPRVTITQAELKRVASYLARQQADRLLELILGRNHGKR
ncbi:MAG TPA: hypothetical protein VIV84_05205 [Burkholderiaceae bacterium]